jgi:hypothetical protein
MKQKLMTVVSVLAVACALPVVAGIQGQAEAPDDQATITGVVRTAQFGARGEVVRVYIDAPEEPILVSRRDRGKHLLAQVGATVRATGYLRKIRSDEGFTKMIDVTAFAVEEVAAQKRPSPGGSSPR